jgi:hypothetical protein
MAGIIITPSTIAAFHESADGIPHPDRIHSHKWKGRMATNTRLALHGASSWF